MKHKNGLPCSNQRSLWEVLDVLQVFAKQLHSVHCASTKISKPSITFKRKHLCNCYLFPGCPLCKQGCDLVMAGLACVFKCLSVAEQASVCKGSSGYGLHNHSELYLVRSALLLKMKHMQPLWTTCSKAGLVNHVSTELRLAWESLQSCWCVVA